MLKLRTRPAPLPPMPAIEFHTDEFQAYLSTPKATAALPESFGPDFNLIRAVQEYGPQRVAAIRNELSKMEERRISLTDEMRTLDRMISATQIDSHALAHGRGANLGQEFTLD